MKDVQVEGGFANAEATGLNAVRVEFLNCRLTGLRAVEAECQGLLIAEGGAGYCQFRFGIFKTSEFKACNFGEADFHGSDLRGALLKGCQFKNVDMTEAKLEGADFRGSSVEGLVANAADLKGAIVDPAQAIKLCRSHGAEDSLVARLRVEGWFSGRRDPHGPPHPFIYL
ncbi:MAG: pentapeptide repeat-containing protein [Candidatus Angelobacter sp.]